MVVVRKGKLDLNGQHVMGFVQRRATSLSDASSSQKSAVTPAQDDEWEQITEGLNRAVEVGLAAQSRMIEEEAEQQEQSEPPHQ